MEISPTVDTVPYVIGSVEVLFDDKCNCVHFTVKLCLQCFDAVGWAAGRASGL